MSQNDNNMTSPLAAPVQYKRHSYSQRRFMIFDVETTGLINRPKKSDPPTQTPPSQPHILQISMLIYDTQFWRVVKSVDLYIRVPEDVVIDPFITNLTGITQEMCYDHGVPIADAMAEFYEEFLRCDCIVAHNIEFDSEMIQIEMARLGQNLDPTDFAKKCPLWKSVFDRDFMAQHEIDTFCTMRVGRKVCQIERRDKKDQVYFKSPKLVELYEHLFGQGSAPTNLHNAFMDAYVCLRCFVKLRFKFDMRLPVLDEIKV